MYSSSSPRPIQYPLDRTLVPSQTGGSFENPPQIAPDWQVSDPDEKVTITLNISLNEYVALASAIDVGRDIAFGDNAIEIWKIWTEVVNTMSICDAVAECILTNDNVKNALIEQMQRGSNVPNNNSETSINAPQNQSSVLVNVGCDLDSIYGACVAIEDYLYQTSRDIWEVVLDTAIDSIAKARLLDYIPVVGDLPVIDDINDLITQMRTFGLNAFDIGYTTTIRQQNICGLFELACDDCELLPIDIATFYGQPSIPDFDSAMQMATLLLKVTGGIYTETLIVRAWMAIVASVLSYGGSVLGYVGLYGFDKIARSGDPDNDWSIFCDPCPPANPNGYEWDLTQDNGAFVPFVNRALYVTDEGWKKNPSTGIQASQLNSVTSPPVGIEYIEIEGVGNHNDTQLWANQVGGSPASGTQASNPYRWVINSSMTGFGVSFGRLPNTGDFTGAITRITVKLQSGETIPTQWVGGTPIVL